MSQFDRVAYCAEEVEGGWNPQIVITVEGKNDIVFVSNVVCETQEKAQIFCNTVFNILSECEKKNLRQAGPNETIRY